MAVSCIHMATIFKSHSGWEAQMLHSERWFISGIWQIVILLLPDWSETKYQEIVTYLSNYLNLCLATCETVVWHMSFQPGVWRKRKMSCECDQSAKLLFLTLVIALNFTFGASLLSRLKCAWLLRPSEAWRHSSWRTSQWGNIMLQCIECIVNEKGEYCWTVTFEHVTFYALRQFCMYYKLVATRRSDKRISCVSWCVVSH